jgi:hypothetical protein
MRVAQRSCCVCVVMARQQPCHRGISAGLGTLFALCCVESTIGDMCVAGERYSCRSWCYNLSGHTV